MINTFSSIFCLLAMSYIIFLEFKNPYKDRDIFIDISISVLLCVIGIFTFYETNFNMKEFASIAYLVLIALSIFYCVIVVIHNKKYKEQLKLKELEDENNKVDIIEVSQLEKEQVLKDETLEEQEFAQEQNNQKENNE